MNSKKESIGLVGSGLIGKNWAMIFASAGYEVTMYDIDEAGLTKAYNDLKAELKRYEQEGTLRGALNADTQISLISITTSLSECICGKVLVQESIPEVLDLKKKLYKQIDQVMDNNVILSSSTSTFLTSDLSKEMVHKSQVIVSHPVNPPYFVPLVEIVPSEWTSNDVRSKVFDIMTSVGQEPVLLKREIPGFALNRIQYAILNECWHLIEDGIMDVEGVDKVMSEGLGMRYAFLGPMETAHLNAEGFRNYSERYANSMYEVCKTFKPAPKLSGPTAEKINQELSKKTPIDKLQERRKWRDVAITQLSQLKRKI